MGRTTVFKAALTNNRVTVGLRYLVAYSRLFYQYEPFFTNLGFPSLF